MDIRINSRAPTRIDLAGGTVDIWPLYLFLANPITINLGIDLFAEATLELASSKTGQGEVQLRSDDQNIELKLPWSSLDHPAPQLPPGLILHFKLLKFFWEKRKGRGISTPPTQLSLRTRAQSPAGAGLGGSSTLSIAMIGALASWANDFQKPIDPNQDGEKFIEIVRDVETTVIQVPAGLQDYYGAMYGGLQKLSWGVGSHQRERLPEDLIGELEKRLLLFYSGQSRNSGINNWALFKGFIDRQDGIQEKFQQISKATHSLENALRTRNWVEVGQAIAEEWAVRKTLASGITTPEVDSAFAEALKLGPISGKVCGAGGGGCFFVYLPYENPEDQLKEQIKKIFSDRGMKPLDFHGVPHGLEVRVARG